MRLIAAVLVALVVGGEVRGSIVTGPGLIGDEVRLFRSIDGVTPFITGDENDLFPLLPDQDDTATVLAGTQELDLRQYSAATGTYIDLGDFDIEADTIRIEFDSGIGFGTHNDFSGWVLSDLDWENPATTLVGVDIVDFGTGGPIDGPYGKLPVITFGPDFVRFNYSGTVARTSEDAFLVVKLNTLTPVPEPGTLAIFGALFGVAIIAHRRKRAAA